MAHWICQSCSEQVDNDFVICWNCGTNRDGKPDPDFQQEVDAGVPTTPSLEDQLAEGFRCVKCDHRGATLRRFAATGTGLTMLFDLQTQRFLAVSCDHCGYSELYNLNVLEGGGGMRLLLDLLIGS